MRQSPQNITKELLEQLYIDEGKSYIDISLVLNKSIAQISRYLKRFGIKPRPFSTKGTTGWNKGIPMSEETKKKLSIAHTGKKLSEETKIKIKKWMIENNPFQGKHHSEESKKKFRQKMVGRKLNPEHRVKVIKTLIFGDVKGEKSHGWKGGISPINARIRSTKPFREWRKSVFERDGYKCVLCGFESKSNHVDHIAPFALYPELRFSLDNGRVLCVKCHRETDTYGGKSRKTH